MTPTPAAHLPADPDPRLAEYAHPERLVTTDWVAEHLGTPGLHVVECDEDVLLYEMGHIPGAVKLDWHLDLNDPVTRDYVDGAGFARVMRERGIGRADTVVIYGDKSNWWAAYALWVMTLFGHEDVRLMDGGRARWEAEGREMTTERPAPDPVDYPEVERDDEEIRASIGADSLGYISLEGMIEATGQAPSSLCTACFTGDYPIPLPDESMLGKHLLESSLTSPTLLPVLNNP